MTSTTMTRVSYVCVYKLHGQQNHTTTESGLEAFQHGFWIDESYQLTTDAELRRFWIPPSAIICVEVIRETYGE